MTSKKARKILGNEGYKISEKQLKGIISSLSNLADIFVEQQKGLVNYGKPHLQ